MQPLGFRVRFLYGFPFALNACIFVCAGVKAKYGLFSLVVADNVVCLPVELYMKCTYSDTYGKVPVSGVAKQKIQLCLHFCAYFLYLSRSPYIMLLCCFILSPYFIAISNFTATVFPRRILLVWSLKCFGQQQ